MIGPRHDDVRATFEALPRDVFVARRRLGLSQREVAERCNTVRAYVSRVERGALHLVPVAALRTLRRWSSAPDDARDAR